MNLSVIFIEIARRITGEFHHAGFQDAAINPLTFISDYLPEIQAEYYRF